MNFQPINTLDRPTRHCRPCPPRFPFPACNHRVFGPGLWVYLCLGSAAMTAAQPANPTVERPPATLSTDRSALPAQPNGLVYSYADMLDKVTPAVVSVAVERRLPAGRVARPQGPMNRDEMMEELLRRFFGEVPRGPAPKEPEESEDPQPGSSNRTGPEVFRREGQGSGFIVSPEGYILTNNHVVEGRPARGRPGPQASPAASRDDRRIIVELEDGREFTAEIVGTDPQTDLAVLKIDGENLPVVTLGDSSRLRVGDLAFAVGNPLGVGMTVSMGIISALNRTDLGIIDRSLAESGADLSLLPPIESFIQTDAAINMGNSGGVLVDAAGRVVGINSAISSIGGGSIGIGFAIPINLAQCVMEQLIDGTELARGFIGVSLESMDREKAKAFGLTSSRGVIINGVTPGLPAAQAGLQPGDVVLAVDGERVDSVRDMIFLISSRIPGSTAVLDIVRWGKSQKVPVVLGDRTQLMTVRTPASGPGVVTDAIPAQPDLAPGLRVRVASAELRKTLSLSEDAYLLEVVSIDRRSSVRTNLEPGLIILEINGRRPTNLETARQSLRTPGNNALFAINSEGRRAFYWLTLTE